MPHYSTAQCRITRFWHRYSFFSDTLYHFVFLIQSIFDRIMRLCQFYYLFSFMCCRTCLIDESWCFIICHTYSKTVRISSKSGVPFSFRNILCLNLFLTLTQLHKCKAQLVRSIFVLSIKLEYYSFLEAYRWVVLNSLLSLLRNIHPFKNPTCFKTIDFIPFLSVGKRIIIIKPSNKNFYWYFTFWTLNRSIFCSIFLHSSRGRDKIMKST